MGIEIIVGLLSAVATVVGAVAQANAAKEAAAAQRESNEISGAQQKVNSTESKRSKVRETRVRRAQILAQSENVGVADSSGEVGAIGALNTNLSGVFGQSAGQSNSNEGINTQNQKAADAQSRGAAIGAFTGAVQSGLSAFGKVAGSF